jgi:hypothetical protein
MHFPKGRRFVTQAPCRRIALDVETEIALSRFSGSKLRGLATPGGEVTAALGGALFLNWGVGPLFGNADVGGRRSSGPWCPR